MAWFDLLILSHRAVMLAPLTKVALKVDDTMAGSGLVNAFQSFASIVHIFMSLSAIFISIFLSPSFFLVLSF